MTVYLSNEFLDAYPAQPAHMTELGAFTAYRTYTRWLDDKMRRETWKEAVTRAVNFSMSQFEKRMQEINLPYSEHHTKMEAEKLFDNIFNLRQFLSGRTHWVGGAETGVGEKFPLANFNCSFIEVKSWEDIAELFYLLMVGTGVGVRASKENPLPPLNGRVAVVRDRAADPGWRAPSDHRLRSGGGGGHAGRRPLRARRR